MVGPTRSRTARCDRDDHALAGVVGMILLLALVVGVYANVLRAEVPAAGADAEGEWARDVARELDALLADASSFRDTGAPLAASVPAAPGARTVDLPLFPSVAPATPAGSLVFDPECGRMSVHHDRHGSNRTTFDVRNVTRGCLTFTLDATYGRPVTYRLEHGGLLRVQADRAFVLRGPAFDVDRTLADVDTVALGVAGLEGRSASASVGAVGAGVTLTPATVLPEAPAGANAANVTWRVETPFPRAWHDWFGSRLDAHGVASGFTLACDPVDCSTGPVTGLGRVTLTLHGPHADRNDVALGVSYASFTVALE